nr:MAG TPA: hypothetical protein [Caudoviricetes sp.]
MSFFSFITPDISSVTLTSFCTIVPIIKGIVVSYPKYFSII